MNKILLLLIALTCNHFVLAQETKFLTKRGKGFNEEYYVLKNDNKVKHGTYVMYRLSFQGMQILESGSYSNGIKNGPWEYYHKTPSKNAFNSIKEKGAYVNGKKNGLWTTYYMDTIPEISHQQRYGNKIKTDSFNIDIDHQSARIKTAGMYLNDKRVGEWTSFDFKGKIFQKYNFTKQSLIYDNSLKDSAQYNLSRNALFIGGSPCLIDFLLHEFDFRKVSEKMKNDSSSVVIAIKIDTNGKVVESKIDKSTGYKILEAEALRLVNLTSAIWLPALTNGEKVESIYKLQFFNKRKIVSANFKKFWSGVNPMIE